MIQQTSETEKRRVSPPRAGALQTGQFFTALVGFLVVIGLLWLDFLWARFGNGRLPQAERFVLLPMVVSAAIASAVGMWQKWVDITWLSGPPWSDLGRAAGSMLDGNSFGTAAASNAIAP